MDTKIEIITMDNSKVISCDEITIKSDSVYIVHTSEDSEPVRVKGSEIMGILENLKEIVGT